MKDHRLRNKKNHRNIGFKKKKYSPRIRNDSLANFLPGQSTQQPKHFGEAQVQIHCYKLSNI
jgi:hypothetical protein